MGTKRLSNAQINIIKELVNEGYSLNQISLKLERSKTTIYHHFLKTKERTILPLKLDVTDQNLLGEFLGLFAGDGSFYKTKDYKYNIRLHFSIKDSDYIKALIENVLKKLFSKRPMKEKHTL